MHETLIGFDVRKMSLNFETLWKKERREQFLLRQDASPVFSADPYVWPSLFRAGVAGFSEEQISALGLDGLDEPTEWIGPNTPLWENLDQLRDFLASTSQPLPKPYWFIALSCFVTPQLRARANYGPYFEPTHPDKIQPHWKLLGYDVADGSGISGLTNCGYTEEDRWELSTQELFQNLNEYHLFNSVESAELFRQISDQRVKEHAPFFVYGLYVVQEVVA